MNILKKIENYKIEKAKLLFFKELANDPLFLDIIETFNNIFEHIRLLATTFDIKNKDTLELATFLHYLIHNGFLSEDKNYTYNDKLKDIISPDEYITFTLSLKVFSGMGCCRNTSTFAKEYFDRFNIENSLAITSSGETDHNLNEIRLLLSNYHCRGYANHVINYVKDDSFDYFVDLTGTPIVFLYGYNQFAYPFNNNIANKELSLPLYKYNTGTEILNFKDIKPISKEKQEEFLCRYNDIIDKYNKNMDLFMQFYFHNKKNYVAINEAYDRIYEKEKRLTLI